MPADFDSIRETALTGTNTLPLKCDKSMCSSTESNDFYMGPNEEDILNVGDRRKDGRCPRQRFSSRDINVMLRYHTRSLATPSCSKAAELPGGFNVFLTESWSGKVNACRLRGFMAQMLRNLVAMDQLEYLTIRP